MELANGIREDELIVDNFAGGGGASLGIEWALGRSPDIAVNHDRESVAMHALNHPRTRHYCEDVWNIDPVEVCGGRPVGPAWFSPDCKHFSKAKGGRPVEKRIRGLAWVVIRWAKTVKPRVIILENVEEFQDWGPLTDDGLPCRMRKGLTFRRWTSQLRNLGYAVEWRELRACDYGAPTIRKRLFIVARCDGRPIVWPEPTHGDPKRQTGLFDRHLQPWRTAAECIDWSLQCPSIFERSKPLAENTLRRIAAGIKRYVLQSPEPFIVNLTHQGGERVEELGKPFKTVTGANRGEKALAVPTLVQTGYGERNGQAPRVPGLDKPLGTVVGCGQKHALVSAFLAKHYGGVIGVGLEEPAGTVTATDHHGLVTSHLVKLFGTCKDGQPVTEPVATIRAQGTHIAEVRAFLLKYYGTDQKPQLRDPIHTLTAKDRMGLVTVLGEEYAIVDIGLRMLCPRELYRAQGFPDSYQIEPVIDGKKLSKTAQVRMCGNSVCPPIAAAVAREQFFEERSKNRMVG